jgi:arylsulfatase A-like enzyme
VKWPGQERAQVVEEWTSLLDLFPTVLDAAGVQPRGEGDGRSLVPLLSGKEQAPRAGGFPPFETRWPDRFVGASIVDYPWKLIWVEQNYEGLTDRAQLFDLARDPAERRDLSAEHPDVVEQLKRALEKSREAAAPLHAGSAQEMDEALLQSLGY